MISEGEMIHALFEAFEEESISYCVLRNVEEIIAGTCHDIDFAIDWSRILDFKQILHKKLPQIGWQVFVLKENDAGELLSIHLSTKEGKVLLMHLDAFHSFNWKGIPLVSNARMLVKKKRYRNIWICSDEVECTLKLFSKYLHSGEVRGKYRNELMEKIPKMKKEICAIVEVFLSQDTAEWILSMVEQGNWEKLTEKNHEIRAEICQRYFAGSLFKRLRYTFRRNLYLGKKFFAKNGPMVAFEGCDGSGKSTIINLLPIKMERIYNQENLSYYHWRPNLLLRKDEKERNDLTVACVPHDKEPYNKLLSFIKYFIFNFDYLLGYFIKVKKQLGQGRLVVFDRYYYDYFIDCYRYRMNISAGILKAFLWMIPKPDVTLILIGTPSVIYERKKEIPLDEVEKQIDRLKEYSSAFHNAKMISVDGTPEETAEVVCRRIIDEMIRKYKEV